MNFLSKIFLALQQFLSPTTIVNFSAENISWTKITFIKRYPNKGGCQSEDKVIPCP